MMRWSSKFSSSGWFGVCRAGGTGRFCLDHRPGYAQPDASVDVRAGLAVLDGDLVAEEGRCAGSGVRDQSFVLVEFELEFITQERCEAGPDLLSFGFWSGEPEEGVVGVPDIAKPPIARVVRVRAGQAALPRTQLACLGTVTAGAGAPDETFTCWLRTCLIAAGSGCRRVGCRVCWVRRLGGCGQWWLPGFPGEGVADAGQDVDAVFAHGVDVAADVEAILGDDLAGQPPGDLLLGLGRA